MRNFPGLELQFLPRPGEDSELPGELDDPIGDRAHSPAPRLVHRYPDRLLVLVTDRCFRYCRFCFRRHWTGRGLAGFTAEDRSNLESYLEAHPEVREVILSGGDPLMLDDESLLAVVRLIRGLDKMVRLSTRAASLHPDRVTPELCWSLGEVGGVWWIHHVNHPDELHAGFRRGVRLLGEHGVGQLSQSVLLKGINDDPEILLRLFHGLSEIGVKPYYLFYTDIASGTSAWRTDLDRAREIWRDVRGRASRLVLPVFAVDLPGGRGKVEVETHYLRTEAGGWVFRAPDGSEVLYPRLDPASRVRST